MKLTDVNVQVPMPEVIAIIVWGDQFHSILAGPDVETTRTVLRQALLQLNTTDRVAEVPDPILRDGTPVMATSEGLDDATPTDS